MQRLVPMANNVTDPAGLNNPTAPWYSTYTLSLCSPAHELISTSFPVVTGAAGNIEGGSSLGLFPPKYLAWGNDDDFGFSLVNFLNRTHLEVQFIKALDGSVLDSAILYKAHAT